MGNVSRSLGILPLVLCACGRPPVNAPGYGAPGAAPPSTPAVIEHAEAPKPVAPAPVAAPVVPEPPPAPVAAPAKAPARVEERPPVAPARTAAEPPPPAPPVRKVAEPPPAPPVRKVAEPPPAPPPVPEERLAAAEPVTEVHVTTRGATPTAVDLHDVRACDAKAGEVCTRTTDAHADKGGLSLHVEEERARAVTARRQSALTAGFTVSGLFGFGENLLISGYNVGANARYLAGGLFPGAEGGSWVGFFAEPSVTIGYTQTTTKTPRTCVGGRCFGGTEETNYSGALNLSLSAGLQYMSFGALDAATFQQEGWGLFGGAQVGSFVPLGEGSATSTFGPALGFVRSKYNPGTGAFEIGTFNLFVLPTKDLFFIVIGGGINAG